MSYQTHLILTNLWLENNNVMVLKIKGKEWKCNCQCQSNCCSEVFLPINQAQKKSIQEKGFWYVDHDYTDFRWLKLHKIFKVEKTSNKKERKITILKTKYEFKYNQFINQEMLYVQDKCSMLLPDNKCKIFRNRPDICKKAECIVFSIKKSIRWYGENGTLKDKVEAYKRGELEKW